MMLFDENKNCESIKTDRYKKRLVDTKGVNQRTDNRMKKIKRQTIEWKRVKDRQ